jgi:predicted alpha/beta superfamily hydrolase
MTQDWQDYPAQQHTISGTVKVLADLPSPQLGNRRDLLVYLPRSYAVSDRHYPVLYMHDGQNLFDVYTSFAGEWQVDETMQQLEREGIEWIVVGIPNAGEDRLAEYSPFPDLKHGGGRGDLYLDFVVDTIKARIDADFRTLPGREHTGIMGSSMGGLISLYGFFSRPDVFGCAGVMSPAFWYGGRAIFPYILKQSYVPGKIYLDAGTAEVSRPFSRWLPKHIGQPVCADARRMYDILRRLGYQERAELSYIEEAGALHNEAAWARRLPAALRFLLV